MKTKVVQHQTLTDIALAATGDARGVIALAVANGKSITATVPPGEDINRAGVLNVDVVSFFTATPPPATAEPQQLEYEAATATPFISFGNNNRSTTITVIEGQSTFDLAIQATGSIEGLMPLLKTNGISLTATPEPGALLNRTGVLNNLVKEFFENAVPGSAAPQELEYIPGDSSQLVVYTPFENPAAEVTAIEGQSTFDLAVQASGSITGLIELLVKNGIQMTAPTEVGLVLKKPALQNASVEAFYKGRGHKPATAFKPGCIYAECGYLEFGYWE